MDNNNKMQHLKSFQDRAAFALCGYDAKRANACYASDGSVMVTVDLHYLNKADAGKIIRNMIAINRDKFQLRIIHGYNHGTVLKDYIMKENFGHRVTDKAVSPWDKGVSLMKIDALV